ncbi:molybdopterin-containing oxidoreductase II, DMSO/TMAO/BSO reductase family, catalytic subunit [Campylobacter blaseri]|uniref:Trimethylamine-N-oxide reductase TorA n=1 Tax=Campylobacter blaseri TaxID=2042961 RepID=A0A2P8R124_9BACT|nr:molybdopterin guanine dinucleotide-containing S/N-oxide reductase [Campylobacter blaseri]PSM52190.1 trimethylamine-N-oxide reductase TorA [Campylobacter blaseri]PSM53956.1 trimethylamine-N-oxide reductase TorA [Campylobacter blaseri]QKF85393.1 molybdopterin-containing oxidoreductase II, DMSO/TMAO/BSO reductase family, catalytic subunit [Campylobacter blaseri]
MSHIKTDLSRRKSLKVLAAAASMPLFMQTNLFSAQNAKKGFKLIKDGEVVTGAHWGVLKLTIKDGKIVKSEALKKTSEIKNPLQDHIAELVYAKDRVKYPYVRKSYLQNPDDPKRELRGADEWVRVSYEEAIDLIAKELKKTIKATGNDSIYAGSYGWKSSGNVQNSRILLHRFMNSIGGFVGGLGDYSTAASQIIMPHVLGTIEVYEQQTAWPLVLEHSDIVVIWGANPISTLRIAWTITDELGFKYFEELKKSGKKIVFIDPIKNETCKYLDAQWIAPRPNTDVAMMLGMMHELYTSGKYDKEFIENYTHGFDKFLPYLLGKGKDKTEKTPKWASEICGIDEKTIKELAHMFYENRTMIMSGWGMQRSHHGEQPHWALVTLCSMLGQIGLPGGGFGLSYHYSNGGVPTAKAGIVAGIGSGTSNGGTGQSWLQKATSHAIPVARIADALLNPGKTIDHNGKKITYPKLEFIYWVGGNPLVHHQDTNTNIKAWRQPRTVVVNEIYWTPTARMADIVMPITTSYERDDISMTGDYSNLSIVPMRQAVEEVGESRDDYEIFTDLAKKFGVEKEYTEGRTALEWIEYFYEKAREQAKGMQLEELNGVVMKPFAEFWEENKPIEFVQNMESFDYVRYGDFREDPILEPLGTPSGLIEIYSETIEKMNYDDCHAHPTWFEPIEWLGMKQKPAEFHMISVHPTNRLHSQQNNIVLRDSYAVANREPIWINEKDAKAKGIKTGDIVRVFNKRGQVLAGAVVTKDIMQGVVKLDEGAWYDPLNSKEANTICKNGSANVLTIDMPTSKLANGNISHTALVNIEKYEGKAPELSIFKHIDPKS